MKPTAMNKRPVSALLVTARGGMALSKDTQEQKDRRVQYAKDARAELDRRGICWIRGKKKEKASDSAL